MPRRSLISLLDRFEQWEGGDATIDRVVAAVQPLQRSRSIKNLLTGVPTGHPAHPPLAQLSLGLFVSAATLALRGRAEDEGAARLLVALGLASAAPTAVTGIADWSHGHEQQKRVGVLHAGANSVALLMFGASLAARTRSISRASVLAGASLIGAGGYLGGHLAFRQSLGAHHAEHVPHRVPPGWQRLCAGDEIPATGVAQRMLGDVELVVLRDGGQVRVLSNTCPHLSAPMHEGDLQGSDLICPWHGSVFDVTDGSVVEGPATAPLPCFEVRQVAGDVMVRLPGAG